MELINLTLCEEKSETPEGRGEERSRWAGVEPQDWQALGLGKMVPGQACCARIPRHENARLIGGVLRRLGSDRASLVAQG